VVAELRLAGVDLLEEIELDICRVISLPRVEFIVLEGEISTCRASLL
jgi:hypothetical protein